MRREREKKDEKREKKPGSHLNINHSFSLHNNTRECNLLNEWLKKCPKISSLPRKLLSSSDAEFLSLSLCFFLCFFLSFFLSLFSLSFPISRKQKERKKVERRKVTFNFPCLVSLLSWSSIWSLFKWLQNLPESLTKHWLPTGAYTYSSLFSLSLSLLKESLPLAWKSRSLSPLVMWPGIKETTLCAIINHHHLCHLSPLTSNFYPLFYLSSLVFPLFWKNSFEKNSCFRQFIVPDDLGMQIETSDWSLLHSIENTGFFTKRRTLTEISPKKSWKNWKKSKKFSFDPVSVEWRKMSKEMYQMYQKCLWTDSVELASKNQWQCSDTICAT